MRLRGQLTAVLALTFLLGCATSASAISLRYVNAPYGQTGPYGMRITSDLAVGGVPYLQPLPNTPSGSTILMVCNDFSGTAPDPAGNPWEVQKHSLTNASLAAGVGDGNPVAARAKFYGNHNILNFLEADERDYRAGAYLAEMVFAAVGNATQEDRWHRALWGLFNKNVFQGGTYDADRNAAYAAVDGGWTDWQRYAVYTRVPLDGPPGGTQEFYARVAVPEAASIATLGLNIGALSLLCFAFRRRLS